MDMSDANFGSHLWVLKTVLDRLAPQRVVEFGMGMYSTLLFIEYPVHLISIEMERHDWFYHVTEKVLATPRAAPVFQPVFAQNPLAYSLFAGLPRPDLVFVDGDLTRAEQAMAALERGVETIVMHDFTPDSFNYRTLMVPPGYIQYNCHRTVGPPTGILTKRDLGELEIPEHTVIRVGEA